MEDVHADEGQEAQVIVTAGDERIFAQPVVRVVTFPHDAVDRLQASLHEGGPRWEDADVQMCLEAAATIALQTIGDYVGREDIDAAARFVTHWLCPLMVQTCTRPHGDALLTAFLSDSAELLSLAVNGVYLVAGLLQQLNMYANVEGTRFPFELMHALTALSVMIDPHGCLCEQLDDGTPLIKLLCDEKANILESHEQLHANNEALPVQMQNPGVTIVADSPLGPDTPLDKSSSFFCVLLARAGVLYMCGQALKELLECRHMAAAEAVMGFLSKVPQDLLLATPGSERQQWQLHYENCEEGLKQYHAWLVAELVSDVDRVSDARERTFYSFSRLCDQMYSAWQAVLSEGQKTGDAKVREMQRVFIEQMLRSSNFNKLLSAVRECHKMLERSLDVMRVDGGASLQDNAVWLSEHGIIRKMLRANLHQRQYAELVLKILQVLTRSGLITNEHLDMLWAVTEAEGTFDVVKSNVYSIIEELAGNLDKSLLELLFAKFEVLAKGKSLADSLRLLELLRKLATSDTARPDASSKGSLMAERLLDMIWQLTMPADAPPELLAADAMADVLREYGGRGHREYCDAYLKRCVEQLRARQGVFTALRTLRSLMDLYGLGDKSPAAAEADFAVLLSLDATYNLQELLVGNLEDFMATARRWLAERMAAAGPGADPAPHLARLPGQGCYSYSGIVEEYLTTISFVASVHQEYYPLQLADRLWAALVLNPVHPDDMSLGLAFMRNGASAAFKQFLKHDGLASLLKTRITALPAEVLPLQAWAVYQDYFVKVNLEEHHLVDEAPSEAGPPEDPRIPGVRAGQPTFEVLNLDALIGTPFMWQVALDAARPDVVAQAMKLLLRVYVHGTARLDAAGARHATELFVGECTRHLMASAAVLAGLPQDAPNWASLQDSAVMEVEVRGTGAGEPHAAARRVQRCLRLLSMAMSAAQLRTMPFVPAHRASFRGQQWQVDVQTPQQAGPNGQAPRTKVTAGANEYVGQVRRRIAAHLGCEPAKLRMLYAGSELRDDGALLSQVLKVGSSRQSIMTAVSDIPNNYTQPPADYEEQWQCSVVGLLAAKEEVYHALLFLADQPHWPDVSTEAVNILQLLPTFPWIPKDLTHALAGAPGDICQRLRVLLLGRREGAATGVDASGSDGTQGLVAPARLLYTLQALHALLFPASSAAGPRQPSGLWRTHNQHVQTVCTCMPLLEEVVARAAHQWQADKLQQALGHIIELHSAVIHLLSNILEEEHIVMQGQLEATAMLSPGTSVNLAVSALALNTPTGTAPKVGGLLDDSEACTSSAVPSATGSPGASGPVPGGVEHQVLPAPDMEVEDVGLEESGVRLGPPKLVLPAATSLELNPKTLASMVGLLVHVCCDAAAAAEQREGGPKGREGNEGLVQDAVAVVRDSLATLGRLLRRHPGLYDVFMSNPRSRELVADALLHPRISTLRAAAEAELRAICLPPSPQEACLWLMTQLAQLRGLVATRPTVCSEYFALFQRVVTLLPEVDAGGRCSDALRALATKLLEEEMQLLGDVDACCACAHASQTDAATAATAAATAALSSGSLGPAGHERVDAERGCSPARQPALLGRFQLILALVRALDKASEGSPSQQQLIQLLTRSYLFPEATLVAKGLDSVVAPDMQRALDMCAVDPEARKAALDLLCELMTGCAGSLDYGVGHLHALHYGDSRKGRRGQPDVSGPLVPVRTPGGYTGLRNGGATCYMNSVMQQLFMQPRIRELVLGAAPVDKKEEHNSVFAQLQVLFAYLLLSRTSPHYPRHFWQAFRDYDGQPIDIKEHQDAYEFFTRLQDYVDTHLRATSQVPAMSAALGGRFAQQIICREGPFRSEREEEFLQISVDVKGKGGLEKSLESYVQGELMEGENAWFCEELGRQTTALRRTCIKQLPQTLVIHLKRFEYDHINMTRHKVRDRFEFPMTLDMYKYTAEGLAALEGSSAAALTKPGEQLESGSSTQPPSRSTYLYELKGVVVHSGSAFAGHYYSYIRERPCVVRAADGSISHVVEGRWFLFDDRMVTPWDPANMEEDCFGGGARGSGTGSGGVGNQAGDRAWSAYMLFYDRKDTSCCDQEPMLWADNPQQQHAQPWAGVGPAGTGTGATPPAGASTGAPTPMLMSPRSTFDGTAATAVPAVASEHAAEAGGGAEEAGVSMDTQPSTSAPPPGAPLASGPSQRSQDATPLAMPRALYQDVLRANLVHAYKQHLYDKDYMAFVKRVLELRQERVVGKVSGKVRRTRLLQHHVVAGESASPHSDAAGSEGTPIHEGGSVVAQWPGAARRLEDFVDFAVSAARLAAGFLLHVVVNAPRALQLEELVAWRELLKPLMVASSHFCTELANVLMDNAHRGLVTEALLHTRLEIAAGIGSIVRDMRACLEMHGNVEWQKAGAEPGGRPLDSPALQANIVLLEWVLNELDHQQGLVQEGQALRLKPKAARQIQNRDAVQAAEQPFAGYQQFFLLLADYYASDSAAIMYNTSDEAKDIDLVIQATHEMMHHVLSLYQDAPGGGLSADEALYLDDFNAAATALLQGLVRVPQLPQLMRMVQPHDAAEQFVVEQGYQAAHKCGVGLSVAGDPQGADRLSLGICSLELLELFVPAQQATGGDEDEDTLVHALTVSVHTLTAGSGVQLLAVLTYGQHINSVVALQCLSRLPSQMPDAKDAGEWGDLGRCVDALVELLNIGDSLQRQRLHTALLSTSGYGRHGDQTLGLLQIATAPRATSWPPVLTAWAVIGRLVSVQPNAVLWHEALAAAEQGQVTKVWTGQLLEGIANTSTDALTQVLQWCNTVMTLGDVVPHTLVAACSTAINMIQQAHRAGIKLREARQAARLTAQVGRPGAGRQHPRVVARVVNAGEGEEDEMLSEEGGEEDVGGASDGEVNGSTGGSQD